MVLVLSGMPVSSPRTVWVTVVKGWYSANWRSLAGIAWVGTSPLLVLSQLVSMSRMLGLLLMVALWRSALAIVTHQVDLSACLS